MVAVAVAVAVRDKRRGVQLRMVASNCSRKRRPNDHRLSGRCGAPLLVCQGGMMDHRPNGVEMSEQQGGDLEVR